MCYVQFFIFDFNKYKRSGSAKGKVSRGYQNFVFDYVSNHEIRDCDIEIIFHANNMNMLSIISPRGHLPVELSIKGFGHKI